MKPLVGEEGPSNVSSYHIGTPPFPNLSAREIAVHQLRQKEGRDHLLTNLARIGVMALEAVEASGSMMMTPTMGQ